MSPRAKKSPEYAAAVAALKQLSAEQRHEACKEALQPDMQALADGRYGKQSTGRADWRRLIGKRSPVNDWSLPGDDHPELRLGGSDPGLAYFSHPYGLTLKTLREIVHACDANGLEVEIDAYSWYNPLSTLAVLYRKAKKS